MLFCLSSTTRLRWLRSDQSIVTLSKMAPGLRGGNKLLNKVVTFVFFAHKKYSCSFVKLWLNHWCHMDYFNNVLTTFTTRVDLDHPCCLNKIRYQNLEKISSIHTLKRWGRVHWRRWNHAHSRESRRLSQLSSSAAYLIRRPSCFVNDRNQVLCIYVTKA